MRLDQSRSDMKMRLSYGTLCGLLLVAGCTGIDIVSARNSVEGSFQRALTVSGPLDLDVSTGSGRIEVRPGASGRLEVRAQVRVSERGRGRQGAEELLRELEMNPPIEQSGNAIRIGYLDNSEDLRNVSISYNITSPPDTRLRSRTGSGSQEVDGIDGPLDVSAGSGSLIISNIQGEVQAQTGSGSIRVADVRSRVSADTGSGSISAEGVAGGFHARTGSGSVRMIQTAPGDVEVSTGSGSVELSGVRGVLSVRTGSGRIMVDGEPFGPWNLDASSGSILVRLPEQASFDLLARTGSGSITVEHPMTVQGRLRRNEVEGTVRAGGFALDLRTGSGSIRIE